MTPEAARASYRRMMDQAGETVLVRIYSGAGDARVSTDYAAKARVTGYAPDELVGDVRQGDRKLIIPHEELATQDFPSAAVVGNKVVVRGKELRIEALDDSTRRIAGQLIAYEIRARG